MSQRICAGIHSYCCSYSIWSIIRKTYYVIHISGYLFRMQFRMQKNYKGDALVKIDAQQFNYL